ncbi:hypothetical protein FisN_13Hh250 [Fistulifera solaris]|uniref:Uncharacterized protein n=1 Tax=Fistulifera solaris TaxID=1519565 RepID=A0A1Z5KNZ7_FISSO|nr:hypothetical protein FisN_13Hh250 [Fistulifera solaris]|eukprot:GAX27658.1 hypothetical protein FisN_13Hh250 [Fistulifera solaris]
MYSDFFDQIGANRRLQRESNNPTSNDEPAPLVSVKAGKMALTKQAQEPVSFQCESIRTRGEIRLLWKDNALKWQWYDRRDREVRDEFVIDSSSAGTFERVPMTGKKHENDRIYVWTRPDVEDEQERYKMYWMQDASEEKDDEIVASINEYLADPKKAAPESDRMETDDSAQTSANRASSTTNANQVDALSNILENLGMPQSSSSEMSTDEPSGARATLTLADLQGAMASIQDQGSRSAPGPVLSDVVTPEAITGILQDEGARNRLMELLPPEQRSAEYLEENLRSPAVQQTLRHLTATLMPDDDWSGFYTVLANFQLDPADGQDAIAAGNPVQAFLDCVLASVKREKEESKEDEQEEEKQDEL